MVIVLVPVSGSSKITLVLAVTVVVVAAAGVVAPIVVPSIVPPLISAVVTEPKSVQVAPAAVGEVPITGEVRVLLVRVCVPTRVTILATVVELVPSLNVPERKRSCQRFSVVPRSIESSVPAARPRLMATLARFDNDVFAPVPEGVDQDKFPEPSVVKT